MSLVLNVEILGEFKKLTTATAGAQTSLQKLQDGVGSIAKGIGRTVGALALTLGFTGIIQGAKDTIQAASNLEQQFGALDSIFKGNSEEMKTFSKEMNQIGLSTADAAKESAYLGSMLKGAGLSLEDTTDRTQELVKLSGDLAATYGGPTSDAVRAIGALMRGERDPIERYGVSLKQVDINAQMLQDAKDGLVFASEKEAAMQATLTLLYQKTTDAQGQAARESETYAGVTGRLTASFTDLQAEMGAVLLPLLSELASLMEDSVPKIQAFFKELLDPTTEIGSAWQELGAVFALTADQFTKMLSVFSASGISFKDVLSFVTTLTAGFGQLFFMVGRVADIIGSLITFNFQRAFDLAMSFGDDFGNLVSSQNAAIMGNMSGPITPVQADRVQNVTINVNNGNITAQEIADKINRGNRSTGTNLIRVR